MDSTTLDIPKATIARKAADFLESFDAGIRDGTELPDLERLREQVWRVHGLLAPYVHNKELERDADGVRFDVHWLGRLADEDCSFWIELFCQGRSQGDLVDVRRTADSTHLVAQYGSHTVDAQGDKAALDAWLDSHADAVAKQLARYAKMMTPAA